MPVYIPTNGVECMELKVTLLKGDDLIAKDRNMMGKRTTSDPYTIVSLQTTIPGVGRSKAKATTKELGTTKTIKKTLSPEWNESYSVSLPCSVLQDPKAPPTLIFKIFDYDKGTDDDCMGIVTLPLSTDAVSGDTTKWYDVPKDSAKNAKGKLQIRLQMEVHRSTALKPGNSFILPSNKIRIGLAWDLVKGKIVDLDAACVAIDADGNLSMENSVYYGNLANGNESIVHSGDSKDGKAEGEDESITFRLDRIPPRILAMYIVLTVASQKRFLNTITSARVTIVDETKPKQGPMASFQPSKHVDSADASALFLVRLARDGPEKWKVQPIEDTHPTARDFGTLIPFFKSYTRDLIPNIEVNPSEIVSVMRKGGKIKIRDFCPGNVLPDNVTFGLSWDMNRATASTKEEKIDLDASCICLNADLQCVDKVWYKHLTSEDGGITHSGDQRRGDSAGDDERIYVNLPKVSSNIQYIGFTVTSFSGQELDDVRKASCHVFDTETGVDIAVHALSDCKFLDGHTALVMGCLYRVKARGGSKATDWCLKIIGMAAQGKTVKDNVDELQDYLEKNPPSAPLEKGGTGVEEEIPVDAEMPPEVPITIEG